MADGLRVLLEDKVDLTDACSLEILMGGRFHFIKEAVDEVMSSSRVKSGAVECAVSRVRASRYYDETSGSFKLKVSDWDNLDGLIKRTGCILIGDTIATGTTLAGIISIVVRLISRVRDVNGHGGGVGVYAK
jgi:hypoxanthine-guanine phosphoribosyltransferase